MKKIEIKNLTKKYGNKKIVENISFSIEKGEICGLLGINGAGKSTIMKCILGITTPTEGEILYESNTFKEEFLRDIGALVEEPPIYDNLSAYENLKVKALLYDIPNEKIFEKLELVNLANEKKKTKNFSMGMKVRLGIALSILQDPDFVILDEPTNGLDPNGIEELKELIRTLKEKGITVLLSSHRFKDIIDVTNRVIILNKGKVAFDGVINDEEHLSKMFFEIVNKE